MITTGIDCGAKNTKTIIMKNNRIIGKGSVLTGFDQKKAVQESLDKAVQVAGISRDDIDKVGGTGAGKDSIELSDKKINDIRAIGAGAHYFFPHTRTVTDVGAEEGRTVKIDEKGNPVDFIINEKCAAGSGVFIEAVARALETTIEEIGLLALESDKEIPITAQCVIFAESEVVGLIHANIKKQDICKAVLDAMARRAVSMIRRVGVNQDVVMLGGVGYNPAFVRAVRRELDLPWIYIPDEPEYGQAVGSAIVVADES